MNPDGDETKLALSDQALAALVAIYRRRNRPEMTRWALVLPDASAATQTKDS